MATKLEKQELQKNLVWFRSTPREVSRKNNNKNLQNNPVVLQWEENQATDEYFWKSSPSYLTCSAESKLHELSSISAFVHFEVCPMRMSLTPGFLPSHMEEIDSIYLKYAL